MGKKTAIPLVLYYLLILVSFILIYIVSPNRLCVISVFAPVKKIFIIQLFGDFLN